MSRTRLVRGASLLAALSLAISTPAPSATAQDRGGLTPLDVMRLRRVADVFPTRGPLYFTRLEPRPPAEGAGSAYRTHLYRMPADGGDVESVVGGADSVSAVAVNPDGTRISYLWKGPGDDHRQVWALPADGEAAATRLTAAPNGVSGYAWRPDGMALACTELDPHDAATAAARDAGFRQTVVDEDYRHLSLWLHDLDSGERTRLTEGRTVRGVEWSPDGRWLLAGISPRNLVDDGYVFTQLHLVDPEDGRHELLVDNPGKLGDTAWSPDGRHVAYVSAADRRDPHAGMLYVVALGDPAPRQPYALTPGLAGQVHEVVWPEDGTLLAAVSRGVRTSLVEIATPAREMRTLVDVAGLAFRGFARGRDGTVYAAASTPEHPDEVFRIHGSGTVPRRLTDSNPWLATRRLGRQETVRFTARDTLEIEGVLMHPVGGTGGQRRPMVMVIHGGPEAHFSDGWNTDYARWGQMLCARGWFAWYPNYRASTGYGVEFAKADHGDPMGGEFRDHVDALRELDRRGLIDRDRVGIGGGSYGGYTAAWAATWGTEHFAAAVSFVPFVDIRTKWLTSDIPYEFYHVHYEERWPHEQPGFLADRSPLTWAPRCRTPLLLLGGTDDTRVHPSQPFMLYRAVKFATETPVRYVQYPGEGHGNGSNVYRYDYAVRTLRWFDHYLGEDGSRTRPLPPHRIDHQEWIR